tara:strand:- start:258 stop:425 length:168 start_codon:yes stop_codon:yes gene_type:complete
MSLTSEDIKRIYNTKGTRQIYNAKKAYNNAKSDWAKKFWHNVYLKLLKKAEKNDI